MVFSSQPAVKQMIRTALLLLVTTTTLESNFDSVQNLERRKEEKCCSTKKAKQRFKYKFRKLSKLQPMTGGGYFQISKSTLTRMLSVRYLL